MQADPSQASSAAGGESGLMKLLDERGMEIMGVEVLLLAVTTVGAIGLDQWRGSRVATNADGADGKEIGSRPVGP
jgi:hypothetical protein